MTPKPRNAKNVSATLATMSRTGGYVAGARSPKSALASVATANSDRMLMTTTTTSDCTRATAVEPRTLSRVMATMSSAANAFVATAGSPAPMALAA